MSSKDIYVTAKKSNDCEFKLTDTLMFDVKLLKKLPLPANTTTEFNTKVTVRLVCHGELLKTDIPIHKTHMLIFLPNPINSDILMKGPQVYILAPETGKKEYKITFTNSTGAFVEIPKNTILGTAYIQSFYPVHKDYTYDPTGQ